MPLSEYSLDYWLPFIGVAGGYVFGALLTWLLLRNRLNTMRARLEERLRGAAKQVAELEAGAANLEQEVAQLRQSEATALKQQGSLEGLLAAERKSSEEKAKLLNKAEERMLDSFRLISQECLHEGREELSEMVKGAIAHESREDLLTLLHPLANSLDRIESHLNTIDEARGSASLLLREQIARAVEAEAEAEEPLPSPAVEERAPVKTARVETPAEPAQAEDPDESSVETPRAQTSAIDLPVPLPETVQAPRLVTPPVPLPDELPDLSAETPRPSLDALPSEPRPGTPAPDGELPRTKTILPSPRPASELPKQSSDPDPRPESQDPRPYAAPAPKPAPVAIPTRPRSTPSTFLEDLEAQPISSSYQKVSYPSAKAASKARTEKNPARSEETLAPVKLRPLDEKPPVAIRKHDVLDEDLGDDFEGFEAIQLTDVPAAPDPQRAADDLRAALES